MCLVVKIISDAKEKYCIWTWNVNSTNEGQSGMVKQEWTIGHGESKPEHRYPQFSSVALVYDSLRPHGLQHTRLPCPSPTPRTCSNSCPSSRWCHPTILYSIHSPPFPIWNQSVTPCLVLTVASWPVYKFLKRQVRWSGIPISFRISHSFFFLDHSLLWSTQSKALA